MKMFRKFTFFVFIIGLLPTNLKKFEDDILNLNDFDNVFTIDLKLYNEKSIDKNQYYLHEEDKHPNAYSNKIRAKLLSDIELFKNLNNY